MTLCLSMNDVDTTTHLLPSHNGTTCRSTHDSLCAPPSPHTSPPPLVQAQIFVALALRRLYKSRARNMPHTAVHGRGGTRIQYMIRHPPGFGNAPPALASSSRFLQLCVRAPAHDSVQARAHDNGLMHCARRSSTSADHQDVSHSYSRRTSRSASAPLRSIAECNSRLRAAVTNMRAHFESSLCSAWSMSSRSLCCSSA